MSALYIALYCTRIHSRILLISKHRYGRDCSMCKYQKSKSTTCIDVTNSLKEKKNICHNKKNESKYC